MVPAKLRIGNHGRVRGDIAGGITYNVPWPTGNGSWGSGAMRGVVMHTEVGFEHNVVDEFNSASAQASATFSVREDGHIHQYGPIGIGWYAWAQEAGNREWYSIEHEDHGDPRRPLTDAQMNSSAQLLEVLSRFAGFPCQVTDSVTGRGFGVHSMGGADWGGHSCPDVPPKAVRSLQRAEIVKRAHEIRKQA